jgi:tRNA threonylcarbamoyladenosine biosynthesis protein TsaB
MLILAIDTALDACAAAVLDTGTSKLIAMESLSMKRGHAEALMPLIARVMKDAALPFAALERIAVTTGPGSFTGLRVGLSPRASRRLGSLRFRPMQRRSSARAVRSP